MEVPLKVVAGAGTGKTLVLAHRFVLPVVEKKFHPARILALTFTENAAMEMRRRIRRLLRLNGHQEIPPLWVHTFHGFAARILRENAYAAGRDPEPDLVTEVQERLHWQEIFEAVFAGEFAHLSALASARLAQLGRDTPDQLRQALQGLVQAAKGWGMTPEEFREKAHARRERFWTAMPAAAQAHAMDPDEIPAAVCQALAEAYHLPELAELAAGASADKQSLPKGATLEVRKLYYSDMRKQVPEEQAQARLDRAQAIERDLIEAAVALYQIYLDRLATEGAIDYDGQIMEAVGLLRDQRLNLAQRYRNKFDYLLIDEFQDTSPNQLEMVKLLARPQELEITAASGQSRVLSSFSRLLVVGDQKQSIYGFRNARPGNIDELLPLEPEETVEGIPIFRPLTESYRLTEPVCAVANRAGEAARPQDPALQPGNPAAGRVIYPKPFVDDQGLRYARRQEVAYVAEQILRLQEDQEIEDLADVAVLLRSRSLFRSLKMAFEQRGVPYQVQGGVGFFEHPLARDVIAWLQLLQAPQQDMYLVRLLARAPYSLNDRQLYLLLTPAEVEGQRKRREGTALEMLRQFLAEAEGRPGDQGEIPVERLANFWHKFAALRELARQASSRQVLDEVWQHCAEHVSLTRSEERAAPVVRATFEGVIDEVSGAQGAPLADLMAALNHYLADDQAELPVTDQPVRGAVQVMTIHRAKGLGFEVVFLPGWRGRSDSGVRYDSTWGLRGVKVDGTDPKGAVTKMIDRLRDADEDDEDTRIAYVGLTRAQRILCVTRSGKEEKTLPPYPDPAYFADLEPSPAEVRPPDKQKTEPVRPPQTRRLSQPVSGAPELIWTSFTELRRLEDCPRAWLLSRQAREGLPLFEPGDSTNAGEVGSRFHQFVAAFYRYHWEAEEADAQALASSLQAGLEESNAERLRGLIAAFLESEWAALAEPREVERPVHLVWPSSKTVVQITGAIDLLLPKSGRLVDFKTDLHMSEEKRAQHALQMHIYQQALRRETGGAPAEAIIVHLAPEQLRTLVLTPAELQAQEVRLESLLNRLVAYASGRELDLRPRSGPHCEYCEFAALCAARS